MTTHALTTREPAGSLSTIPDTWLAGQLSASSIRVYRIAVRDYQEFCTRRSLSPLRPSSLGDWRDDLITHTSKSPNTINRELAGVRRFVREGALPSRGLFAIELAAEFAAVPGVRTITLKGRLKQHARVRIEPRDLRALCELPNRGTLIGARDAALLATFASSGVRNAELAGLRRDQVVTVGEGEGGYALMVTGKKDIIPRSAYLSQEAHQLIQEWLEMRGDYGIESDYVFTGFVTASQAPLTSPLLTSSVWRIVHGYAVRYASLSGKDELAWLRPHDLRRFLGTQLVEREGLDVAADALGHKNIQTTNEHYNLRNRRVGLTDHLY
jgi:integrase